MNERLNPTLLEELKLLMEDDFPVLLETFLAESERQLGSLKQAWQAGEGETLRRAAHSLKGSCGNVGAEALARLCADLERQAKQGEAPVDVLMSQIEAEVDAVRTAVRELARSAGTG